GRWSPGTRLARGESPAQSRGSPELLEDVAIIGFRADTRLAVILQERIDRQLARERARETVPGDRLGFRRAGGLVDDLAPRDAPFGVHAGPTHHRDGGRGARLGVEEQLRFRSAGEAARARHHVAPAPD